MYKARQFAELAGVTVRTLHHYDRRFLQPKSRTASGYRLYEEQDLERLEQIAALKYLGLSLRQIRTLLGREPADFLETLRLQRRLFEQRRMILDTAIQAIDKAESQVIEVGKAGPDALRNIMEVIEMETNEKWIAKYATAEGHRKIEGRKSLWSPELQKRVSKQWGDLILDVEESLEEDPAGQKAQALAARWNGLVEEFTGRDKDIEESVGRAWADRENWPVHMDHKSPVIRPQVWSFIACANAASGYSST